MMMHAVALLESAQHSPSAPASSARAGAAGGAGAASPAGSSISRGPTDTAAGMSRLVRYLGAMGRYGETAFILSQYGSGEVAQAFSRACAVHGGIYMLRTSIDSISLVDAATATEKKEDTAADTDKAPSDEPAATASAAAPKPSEDSVLLLRMGEGQEVRCRNLAGTAAFLPRSIHRALPASAATVGAATAVVAPPLGPADFALAFPAASLSAAELPSAVPAPKDRTRFFLVIPPHTAPLGNASAVYVLQQGAGNAMTPDDSVAVLNVWTQVDTAPGSSGSDGCSSSSSSSASDAGAGASHASREAAVAVVQRVLAALFGSSDPEPEPAPAPVPAPAPAAVDATPVASTSGDGTVKAADADTATAVAAAASDAAAAPEVAAPAFAAAAPTSSASESPAPAAAPAVRPVRRCKLLFRQLLSYQSKDTSPAALRASGAPAWLLRRLHVLSGRAAQCCRVSSEFDAEEARRVFAAVAPGKRFLGPVATPSSQHGQDADADADAGADEAAEAAASGEAATGSAADAMTAAEVPAESSSSASPAAAAAADATGAQSVASTAEAASAAPAAAAGEDDLGGLDLDSALALLKDDLD